MECGKKVSYRNAADTSRTGLINVRYRRFFDARALGTYLIDDRIANFRCDAFVIKKTFHFNFFWLVHLILL